MQIFERHLEDNLFALYNALKNKSYKHGGYFEFYVNDPKRRHIHKANVVDRIGHHLLYKYLYSIFDKGFIYDSYSCRLNKGTHKAFRRLEKFARKLSKNYKQDCWALKLDIKKFFATVDQEILMGLIKNRVRDKNLVWLLKQVIDSFHSEYGKGKGIPLGNLTSQVFANIYLNELDQFIKHKLKVKHYLRYADDFIILDQKLNPLYQQLELIRHYLKINLNLELHPGKISLRKLSWGIDFCGSIVLPHYKLTRTKTKRRIVKRISRENITNESLQSYLGYVSHANSWELSQNLKNIFYLKGD